jgi:hypothetical protein
MIGGQLLFIILGVLVITFGLSTDFPSDAAKAFVGAINPKTSPNEHAGTIADKPTITPVNTIKTAAVAVASVIDRVRDK